MKIGINSPRFDSVSPHFGAIFSRAYSFGLLFGWQVCILGWVSDKCSYLLKPCCNYVFQVSMLPISTKVMEENDNLCTFFKTSSTSSLTLIWKPQEKSSFHLSKSYERTFLLRVEILSKIAQGIYFYLLVASLYLIQSKLEIFIHSFIHSFHGSSHALINDFKPCSFEENITKSCIFESNNFFLR